MTLGSTVALAVERVLAPVEAMHRHISTRWFDVARPASKPVRAAHNAVTGLVYESIRVAGRAVGIGLDAAIRSGTPTTDAAQAFANGLWGDALGRYERSLATVMAIRDGNGRIVPPDSAGVGPEVTGRIVVLIHGLVETERCWYGSGSGSGLINALEGDPALTPLAIRYNTGLPISANGAALARLVECVWSGWPVPVESVALVGFSMGGLVARNACAAAQHAGHRWIGDLTDVVTLGTPHRGVALEKLAVLAARSLALAPVTRPLADFLEGRSAGIKGLRFGTAVEPGQVGPATVWGDAGDAALPADVAHHFVAGVVTSDPSHPFGAIVGDLMVRPGSGTGAGRLEPANVAVFGGVNHFDLRDAPAIIDRVVEWLRPPTRDVPGPAG